MRAESEISNRQSQITRRVRWGVLGSGGIARRRTIPEGIVPARNAELVAVFDVNAAANADVAKQFGARAVGSVAELLKADVDAVYVASPPKVHRGQTLACAQAGKHVLCEKPLGLTVADAEAMLAACQQAGVRLGTAFMMRFHAQHQAALQLIRDGQLGRPVFARAQLSCWYPLLAGAWRQDPAAGGGGALMDMGGHCIDLLEMFFGPVRAVSCFTNRTIHDYASEDSAVASLQFANGALGVVDAFFCVPDEASQNRLELYGSLGSILAKGTIGQSDRGEMVACLKKNGADYDAQQTRPSGGAVLIDPTPVNMYQAEIEEFSQALLDGRELSNHAQLGLQSQRVLAACYESAKTRQAIEVNPPSL
ncbi:MAG: Gfo/Idh/MocA family oxidoreductase [Verrucomicrobia bacterium]|nr:Gfo/Idh/MocA family oxidoreductase [Verrucomicrobiota bacterium]